MVHKFTELQHFQLILTAENIEAQDWILPFYNQTILTLPELHTHND